MKKKYCKTCNTATKHSSVADGDKKNGIIRCERCGRRPDRPRDGHTIKTACPTCQKKCNAYYFDEDGADSYSIQCPDCGGDTIVAHDDLLQSQTDAHKKAMAVSQALAEQFLNKDLHIVGGLKIDRVTITIGSATATAERK